MGNTHGLAEGLVDEVQGVVAGGDDEDAAGTVGFTHDAKLRPLLPGFTAHAPSFLHASEPAQSSSVRGAQCASQVKTPNRDSSFSTSESRGS